MNCTLCGSRKYPWPFYGGLLEILRRISEGSAGTRLNFQRDREKEEGGGKTEPHSVVRRVLIFSVPTQQTPKM